MKSSAISLRRRLCIISGILLLGIISGSLLLIMVFALPVEPIQRHVVSSSPVFEQEGTYPRLIESSIGTQLDNFTDALMLMKAAGPRSESLIADAFDVRSPGYRDKNPNESLVAYAHGEKPDWIGGYQRYWHGYLVILKPMLSVAKYQYIRQLNTGLQLLIFTLIIVLLMKRKLGVLILPFSVAMFALFPPAVALSLQYSSMFYLGCAGMIWLLLRPSLNEDRLFAFFLIVGMLTSYFDFLTYPVFTLGMPLTLWIVMTGESEGKTLYWHLVEFCAMWALGYVCMWGAKWILATIFTDTNVIANAWNQLVFRSSHANGEEQFTLWGVYKRNLGVLLKNRGFDLILFFAVIGMILYRLRACGNRIRVVISSKVIALAFIALLPLVWLGGAANHSFIHIAFTYRDFAVSVFAGLVLIALALRPRD